MCKSAGGFRWKHVFNFSSLERKDLVDQKTNKGSWRLACWRTRGRLSYHKRSRSRSSLLHTKYCRWPFIASCIAPTYPCCIIKCLTKCCLSSVRRFGAGFPMILSEFPFARVETIQMGRMKHKARKEILLILFGIAKLLCSIDAKWVDVMGEYGSTSNIMLK